MPGTTLYDQVLENAQRPLIRIGAEAISALSIFRGLVVLVLAALLARVAARGLTQVLERRNVAHGTRFALSKITRYVILLIGGAMALTSVGIRLDALLAASTVILVGIGFGLQNIAQNFVSGIILLIERPVARGDFVRIGEALGTVVDIGMRATVVVTRDEVTIIVPNSQLVTAQVINHSVPTNNLRVWIHVGVAYGSDTDLVRRALLGVAEGDAQVLREPAPEVRFDGFGESSLEFSLLVWIDNPREDLRIASRLRFAIDAAFRRERIVVPFPQRDVRIVSGADALRGRAG